jgi:hypothetical protein
VAAEPFPFPVGDDPNDPDVLEYWMSVARPPDRRGAIAPSSALAPDPSWAVRPTRESNMWQVAVVLS